VKVKSGCDVQQRLASVVRTDQLEPERLPIAFGQHLNSLKSGQRAYELLVVGHTRQTPVQHQANDSRRGHKRQLVHVVTRADLPSDRELLIMCTSFGRLKYGRALAFFFRPAPPTPAMRRRRPTTELAAVEVLLCHRSHNRAPWSASQHAPRAAHGSRSRIQQGHAGHCDSRSKPAFQK